MPSLYTEAYDMLVVYNQCFENATLADYGYAGQRPHSRKYTLRYLENTS